MDYVLITSAYNEAKYISKTIESVVQQKHLPLQWIIVSDNSTDGTNDIIKEYALKYPLISFVLYKNQAVIKSSLGRVSKRVVACVREGMKYITVNYDYIGFIDADISFDAYLFDTLLKKFEENTRLGLGGGYVYNVYGDKKYPYFVFPGQVSGALQFFRKECWNQIGGYYPGGHHDYFAVKSCMMHNWEVRSFEDLEILHFKNISSLGANRLKIGFYLGQMDYICGELFIYAFLRAVSQITHKPFLLGSCMRVAGYIYSSFTRTPKQVPANLLKFLRKEQVKFLIGFYKKFRVFGKSASSERKPL
jgi:biofilm PGA synthesis N-glycosyltransferase PgaC